MGSMPGGGGLDLVVEMGQHTASNSRLEVQHNLMGDITRFGSPTHWEAAEGCCSIARDVDWSQRGVGCSMRGVATEDSGIMGIQITIICSAVVHFSGHISRLPGPKSPSHWQGELYVSHHHKGKPWGQWKVEHHQSSHASKRCCQVHKDLDRKVMNK